MLATDENFSVGGIKSLPRNFFVEKCIRIMSIFRNSITVLPVCLHFPFPAALSRLAAAVNSQP